MNYFPLMFTGVVFTLWLLIWFEVSFNLPEDGNKHFPKRCVVLCFVATEKFLININDKT
jgi:hypothetical protein